MSLDNTYPYIPSYPTNPTNPVTIYPPVQYVPYYISYPSLTPEQVREIIREELVNYFKENKHGSSQKDSNSEGD